MAPSLSYEKVLPHVESKAGWDLCLTKLVSLWVRVVDAVGAAGTLFLAPDGSLGHPRDEWHKELVLNSRFPAPPPDNLI